MSARPRPVTATINPPLTSTPLHGPRTFLSSDGSTESLISILDHDSYESLPPSDDEDVDQESKPEPSINGKITSQNAQQKKDGGRTKNGEGKSLRKQEGLKTRATKSDENARVSRPQRRSELIPRPQSAGNRKTITLEDREKNQLTHWEEWLVGKAKEMRKEEERKRRDIETEREKKKQNEEDKNEADKRRAERAEEYLKKKEFKDKLRKNREKQRQQSEHELAAAAKLEVEQKAKSKVEEWRKMKAEEERKRKQKEKEEKELKEKIAEENLVKSQQKVQSWFDEIKKRPRSAPRSYGYCQGKLTGYYDRNAYPQPAFYNPIPWQPIPVPNLVTEKKKVKKPTKKRFNVSNCRYLRK